MTAMVMAGPRRAVAAPRDGSGAGRGLVAAGGDMFALPRVGVGRHDDAARLRIRI